MDLAKWRAKLFDALFTLSQVRWDLTLQPFQLAWSLENQGPQITIGADPPSLSATPTQPGLLSDGWASITAAINLLSRGKLFFERDDPGI